MPRLNRQQSQAQTRQRLRSAAGFAFARQGVRATTIDGIAEAAGFSRGAFYSNYAGKRDLLLELVTESLQSEAEIWTGLIEQAAGLDEVMGELAARFDRFVAGAELGALSVELQLEARRDPEFGRHYQAENAALMGNVGTLVRSLFAKAGHAPPRDAELIALTLRGLAAGLVLQADAGAGAIVTRFLRCALESPIYNDGETL